MPKIFVFFMLIVFTLSACGNINARKGETRGMSFCQDMEGRFHFSVFIPPWKHVREYRCDDGDFRNCNQWTPTGRYVFVVSDSPFVSFDSEIITSLTIEETTETASDLVNSLLNDIRYDNEAALDPFTEDEEFYVHKTYEGKTVYDVYWTQTRDFDGKSYQWNRRDAFIETGLGSVYHLEFFSIKTMKKPEFDLLVESFVLGPAPDGAPHCECMDERAVPPEPCF